MEYTEDLGKKNRVSARPRQRLNRLTQKVSSGKRWFLNMALYMVVSCGEVSALHGVAKESPKNHRYHGPLYKIFA
jgi:hypothetical protein